ncbi:hypothetical protein F383_26459 [Gossypium arboreum]|uniref:Uncharacterized protein n=1 Tax=Gossypium arboreum TaxID=29729 RepID=A0A0B0PBW0_GOSAR|nr:hypothetical protein F383_26459 [Gossypium arboreum]
MAKIPLYTARNRNNHTS